MSAETHDVVVVGGGTGGVFAAATVADAGLDVVLLERKPEEEAGNIACGDAIKGKSTFPDVIDREYLRNEAFTNENIRHARFENPQTGESLDIPFDESGAVVDRKRYGEVLLEEADRVGVDVRFDTVVQDVLQEDGQVVGVTASRNGEPKTYEGDVVVDAAGSLSILQDRVDFENSTFDTNVSYQQYCSAYREIIEVDEPVDYDDAIVFTPTEELGYLWYFPRDETTINAGLGFQMDQQPIQLVDALKRDLQARPEFENATVVNKLGAALPTRRPYDSAVAPGYVAVGDAAAHVNPATGGGIPGAAKAGHWAAKEIVTALEEGDPSEAALWKYNRDVMTNFGKRFAAIDVYNIWATAHDVDELTSIITAIPGQALIDTLSEGGTEAMGLGMKLQTLVGTFGHWRTIAELYRVHRKAAELKSIYDDYPRSPAGFEDWRDRRDEVLEDVYDISDATPKY
ncbi:geranylgeranyl reductase family protein [Halanaeroarchaeum sulfurireducens]|uniref:Electron transfer flavoprotein n=1 Tax=Halanaeroarchaeum sulfurireducens TaxID=1604004 RepID=A0A0F7P912_9EURY|nr:geranylgeranyl reductase family protein [Halanaeroarchaeum sulfurireducens]AKH97242.1 electron transfer flavoprotein [Halanaeroarchaeum sulfurireducens]ALG81644.1 electron transfer flavoprotein [Halanaeroarchaeum sulfurireducens]